jgi:hypothetical protein
MWCYLFVSNVADDTGRSKEMIHLDIPGAFLIQLVALIFAGLATRRKGK